MAQTPQVFTTSTIKEWTISTYTKDNTWVPARPYSIPSIHKRFKLAWLVFIGRYDALDWDVLN